MSPPAPQTLTAISSGVVLASQIVKRHVPLGTWGASCPTAGCRGRGASVASCALRRRLECLGREGTTRRRGEARAPMPPEFCVTTRKQAFQRIQKIKKTVFQRKTYMPRCAHISLSQQHSREIGRLAAWAVPWAIAHREDHQSCRRGPHSFIRLLGGKGGGGACSQLGAGWALRVSYRQSGRRRLSKKGENCQAHISHRRVL